MDLKPFQSQLETLCRENNIAMLGVFGSVARGDDEAESDIDLLIKLKKPVGLVKFIQIEDQFVDLATENSLHPLIKDNVMSDMKVLYED
jgi:predicted nucleotidyltransferase